MKLSNIQHEYCWIDLNAPRFARPTKFVAVSKFGEVPVLIDEGRAFCQSNAILIYLAQKSNLYCGSPTEWQGILEWLSWEANRIGFSVPNLRFSLMWAKSPPDVLYYLRNRALADLKTLDLALASSEFLLPSGPTIADISCSAYLFWLSQAGLSEIEYPNIQRWLAVLSNLPKWLHPDDALEPETGTNMESREG